jgi:four helix bundle protein
VSQNNHLRDGQARSSRWAATALGIVIRVPAPFRPIADQVVRSAASVPSNLAEGHGRSGRDRTHFWKIAYASAKEVDSHLRLPAGAGAVHRTIADDVLSIFDEVRAVIRRLNNPRKP